MRNTFPTYKKEASAIEDTHYNRRLETRFKRDASRADLGAD